MRIHYLPVLVILALLARVPAVRAQSQAGFGISPAPTAERFKEERQEQDIRTTIFELHGSGSGTTRLRQRLDAAIAAFSGSGLRTTAKYVGPLSVIDATLADHVEAVVREAVSNAVRHAKAQTLTINVRVEDELSVEVVDDGCGMPADVTASGLNNLSSRAREMGGDFSVSAAPGGGTVLRWAAPLP